MINENMTIEIPWNDLFRISSGKNSDGYPRSAATLAIDKIVDNKPEKIKEVFLKNAIISFCVSGGCATIIVDYPQTEYASFQATKNMYESWFTKEILDEKKELSLTVVPFALAGKVVLLFTNLVFADNYQFMIEKQKINRIIFCFDNNSTAVATTDEINYMHLYNDIKLELKRMEDEIDSEIDNAIEEEREALAQMNEIDLTFKKQLNDPLNFSNDRLITEDEKVKKAEKAQKVRFVEEKENMR